MHWPPEIGPGTTQTLALIILASVFVVLALLLLVARARRRRRQRRRAGAATANPQPASPSAAPATAAPTAPPIPATPPAATPPAAAPPIPVAAAPAPIAPAPPPGMPASPVPAAAPSMSPAAGPAPVTSGERGAVSLSEAELAEALRQQLGGGIGEAGLPATPDRVVWVEGGDEVVVHLDSLRVQVLDRILLASLDLETDQTGRQTLAVPFALASEGGPGGLVAVTEETPRGDAALVARWGHTVQEAIWAGVLALASDAAKARGQVLLAISGSPGSLRLRSAPLVGHPIPTPAA